MSESAHKVDRWSAELKLRQPRYNATAEYRALWYFAEELLNAYAYASGKAEGLTPTPPTPHTEGT